MSVDQVEGTRSMHKNQKKKPYQKPELIQYGDIRTITLDPSPGDFESGGAVGWTEPGAPGG